MKNEKIEEFLTKLAQEEGFKVEFLKLKEKVEKKGFSKKDNEKFISECLLPWSKKLGYKLTKKDFIDFDITQKPTEITGLSPAELENVSGGGFLLLSLLGLLSGVLAGGIGGGTTGNDGGNSIAEYSTFAATGSDYSLSSSYYGDHLVGEGAAGATYDWTQDPENFKDPIDGKLVENDSEADFNNPFVNREPIYTQPGLDSTVDNPSGSAPIGLIGYEQSSVGSGTAEGTSGSTAPTMSDWTQDPENFKDPIDGKLVENDSEADFNNPFANRDPIYTQEDLDSAAGQAGGESATTPTAPQGSTGIASYDYDEEYDDYEANYGWTPVDSTARTRILLRRLSSPLIKDFTELRKVNAGKILLLRELNALRTSFDELPIDRRDDIRSIFTSLKNRTRESTSLDDLKQLELELNDLKAVLPEPSAGVPIREDYRLLYDGYEADYGETLG